MILQINPIMKNPQSSLGAAVVQFSFLSLILLALTVPRPSEAASTDNFKAQTAEGISPSRFDGVTGLVIRNSPSLQ